MHFLVWHGYWLIHLSCIDSNKVVLEQVMLVDVSWTWLAVHRGNKLINKSSGHCQPFWINGNRAYNDHDQMMTFAWSGESFCRDRWPLDSWLTGCWRLDRIGTMASSNAVLVRRQVRGAVPRNLRDPYRSHTNPEQGPSQWESSWASGGPLGMWDCWPCSDFDGFPPIVADACWFRGATKRARN